jgi:hypothetical protein
MEQELVFMADILYTIGLDFGFIRIVKMIFNMWTLMKVA